MGFTECSETTSALVNLPADRFITVPPHFLQVNAIYEIIFELSGTSKIEDNHQTKKDHFLLFL